MQTLALDLGHLTVSGQVASALSMVGNSEGLTPRPQSRWGPAQVPSRLRVSISFFSQVGPSHDLQDTLLLLTHLEMVAADGGQEGEEEE